MAIFVIIISVQPPEVVNGSQSPTGDILPTHSTWSVAFDLQVSFPNFQPLRKYFKKSKIFRKERDLWDQSFMNRCVCGGVGGSILRWGGGGSRKNISV